MVKNIMKLQHTTSAHVLLGQQKVKLCEGKQDNNDGERQRCITVLKNFLFHPILGRKTGICEYFSF